MRIPATAQQDLGALGFGVGDQTLDLVERILVDQRSLADAIVETRAGLQLFRRLDQFGGKGIVDLVLHEKAVGADTGDRKSGVVGKSVAVRVDLGGGRLYKKKNIRRVLSSRGRI